MNYRALILFALLLLLLPFSLCTAADFWSDFGDDQLLEILMEEMSDEQLLAQMMLLGYLDGMPSKEILDWIKEEEIGGIKIFGWNVGGLPALAESISIMQRASQKTEFRIPLFIVTDQEGGWVRHIHTGTSESSGNMSLAASGLPADSWKTGYYIGIELRSLGINMNFAPTVDVYSNPEAHVIGPRAFSDDPLTTAVLSTAYFKGMDQAGIICTAKHYPGHGDADKDSHGALPIIHADRNTLWERDLLPYRYLVKEGIPAIMSGHLAYPDITGSNIPSSLSPIFLTEILRDKIGFEGLVVTDDLMMNGVQLLPMTTAEICEAAIMAGNDVILISRTPEIHIKVWNYLKNELKDNPDFLKRVRESGRRVLKTKIRYLSTDDSVPLYPDADTINRLVPDTEGTEFFFDQALRSATEIRKSNSGPGFKPEGRILLAGQLERFFTEGRKIYPEAETFSYSYTPFYTSSEWVKKTLRAEAKKFDTVIFCLANPNSADVLKSLEGSSARIIVLSVLTPIYLADMSWVSDAIAVYGTSRDSFKAGFGVISGSISAQGKLPLNFEEKE